MAHTEMDTEAKVIPAPHHGFIEKKEAHWIVEALWTKRTAGLAPGHYSDTENVLVLLLNVLGKSLHNICTSITVTQTNVHKHVWVVYN